MTATDSDGNVVRINVGRVGALIGVLLFVIQLVTLVVVLTRSAAKIEARLDVQTSRLDTQTTTTASLVDEVSKLTTAIGTLESNAVLNRFRIETLEGASPSRRAPRP